MSWKSIFAITAAIGALTVSIAACDMEYEEVSDGVIVDKDTVRRTYTQMVNGIPHPRTDTRRYLWVDHDAVSEDDRWRVSASTYEDCEIGDIIDREVDGTITCH